MKLVVTGLTLQTKTTLMDIHSFDTVSGDTVSHTFDDLTEYKQFKYDLHSEIHAKEIRQEYTVATKLSQISKQIPSAVVNEEFHDGPTAIHLHN